MTEVVSTKSSFDSYRTVGIIFVNEIRRELNARAE
jgi:hypothetical protein